jgi:hypothetical protein
MDHLGLPLIDWPCMPKAPRQATDHALRDTPDQRPQLGQIGQMEWFGMASPKPRRAPLLGLERARSLSRPGGRAKKRHRPRTSRLPLSQIPAVLLNDFGVVDIR